jgi:hypothetical protein
VRVPGFEIGTPSTEMRAVGGWTISVTSCVAGTTNVGTTGADVLACGPAAAVAGSGERSAKALPAKATATNAPIPITAFLRLAAMSFASASSALLVGIAVAPGVPAAEGDVGLVGLVIEGGSACRGTSSFALLGDDEASSTSGLKLGTLSLVFPALTDARCSSITERVVARSFAKRAATTLPTSRVETSMAVSSR